LHYLDYTPGSAPLAALETHELDFPTSRIDEGDSVLIPTLNWLAAPHASIIIWVTLAVLPLEIAHGAIDAELKL
jgi:hypothetical protein